MCQGESPCDRCPGGCRLCRRRRHMQSPERGSPNGLRAMAVGRWVLSEFGLCMVVSKPGLEKMMCQKASTGSNKHAPDLPCNSSAHRKAGTCKEEARIPKSFHDCLCQGHSFYSSCLFALFHNCRQNGHTTYCSNSTDCLERFSDKKEIPTRLTRIKVTFPWIQQLQHRLHGLTQQRRRMKSSQESACLRV